MFIKASLLSLLVASVSTFTQAADDLIFSEYVEGSDHNKAFELYNLTNATLDLNQYQVEFYFNGSAQAGARIPLSGSLAAGDVYVVADHNASAEILVIADLASKIDFFNGNDAIVLTSGNVVVDSLGQVGFDPGIQWGSGTLSTQNNTLTRDPQTLIADTVIDDVASLNTWLGFAQDDITDLGQFDGADPVEPPIPVELVCHDPAVSIHTLQGPTDVSPLNGQTIEVEAIVISDQESGLKGFFMQMPDNAVDADPLTSEGVFVYTGGNSHYLVGDLVRVQAAVTELNGLTQLADIVAHTLCGSSQAIPSAVNVTLPVENMIDLEAFEGMRVSFAHDLVVNEVYHLGRYGELMLGSQRHFIGTQVAAPGSDALAVSAANARDTIILDDASSVQNPDPIRYPAPGLDSSNTVRVGDIITDLNGLMHFGFGKYRLIPVDTVNFVAENTRSIMPDLTEGGNVTVASFNVLNYFNGDGFGGGFPTSRGADTAIEFARQRAKIISAMVGINADIFGLMEIENDGFGSVSAIGDLVSGLNEAVGDTRYAYINAGGNRIGTDAIAVGMIYRRDRVSPQGGAQVLSSANSPLNDAGVPLFNDHKNRPMLTQIFTLNGSKQSVVVAVNHFKSKGSDCDSIGDPDLNDGQANCNLTRTYAAQAASIWLAERYPQAPVLLIGDLNAYAQEDPLSALKGAGFTELFEHFEKSGAYSYVFSGGSGQLDHALANSQLLSKVIDVTEWHINTDEPSSLDYNTEFKSDSQLSSLYNTDAYRSSDHDPIIISLLLEDDKIAPVASFTADIEGARVSFTSTSTDEDGSIVSHLWDFGDHSVWNSQNVVHQYVEDGDYTVTLIVTDDAGLSNRISSIIIVKTKIKRVKPVAVIKHIKFESFDVYISQSYDEDGDIVQQRWKFNDGSKVSGSIAIMSTGQASRVKLVVRDNDSLRGSARLRY